jgi:molybdopterin biosynthesis enzyme
MASADCFIMLGVDTGNVPADTVVDVQPFQGLL